MNIIIEFIIKSIREKKFRTFLILMSITISSALLFSSIAISGTVEKTYIEKMKNAVGNAEIIIEANEESPSLFFNTKNEEEYKSNTEYIIGSLEGQGFFIPKDNQVIMFNMKGLDMGDLKKMNPIEFFKKPRDDSFIGNKIIISKNTSEKYNLNIGSTLELSINNVKHNFIVDGISQPTGLFADESFGSSVVLPKETMQTIFNTGDKVSKVYIKANNNIKKDDLIAKLSKIYNKYGVKEPFTKEDVLNASAEISIPLMMMVAVVFFMSIFIIYSAFKVIVIERLPSIGVFRSIGANRKTTNLILIGESTVYGLIGGVLGTLLGIGILYIMAVITTPEWMRDRLTIEFSIVHVGVSFLASIILSIISSLIPIIRTSKVPIKDIILNKFEDCEKKANYKFLLGLSLLLISIVVPVIAPKEIALVLNIACLVLGVLSVVLLTKPLTNTFIRLFERVYEVIFGNEGTLAINNLRNNKSILNNISLLTIGISVLFMINIISSSVSKELINYFGDESYKNQIMLSTSEADEEFEKQLREVNGVKATYGIYEAKNLKIVDKNEEIADVEGALTNKFFNYSNVKLDGDGEKLLQELGEGRNILITNALREKIGVEKGESITLKMKTGEKKYKVIGFYNSIRENGSYAILPEKYLKEDMEEKYYITIRIKTSIAPEEVKKAIFKRFPDKYLWVENMDDFAKKFTDSSSRILTLLQGFTLLTMIIGIFGVLNNYIISFIERKHSIAVLRSLGMSKKQSIKMIFIEALIVGIIGGITGILGGVLMVHISSFLMKAMNTSTPIHFSIKTIALCAISGVIITIIASISSAMKTSKMSIVESIKYE